MGKPQMAESSEIDGGLDQKNKRAEKKPFVERINHIPLERTGKKYSGGLYGLGDRERKRTRKNAR